MTTRRILTRFFHLLKHTAYQLAENCQYGGLCGDLIRDKVVDGIKFDKVREKLLGTNDLKLDRTIEVLKTN